MTSSLTTRPGAFRRLPLPAKLWLIGLLPSLFLVVLTWQIYKEKNTKLNLLNSYIDKIELSADLSYLITAMQNERKSSYDFALEKVSHSEVVEQRKITDTAIAKLKNTNDASLRGFTDYTTLHKLAAFRAQTDSNKSDQNAIMHYYSNNIFRLNTLNTISIPNNSLLQPIAEDFASQKLLTEMVTYLGLIRSNIYNVLVTRKYMVETLVGLHGTWDVYNSFEKEFKLKASPFALNEYNKKITNSDLWRTTSYLQRLFRDFKFDSSFTADEWWVVSDNGVKQLSQVQKTIWDSVENKTRSIYNSEKEKRDRSLIILSVILALVISLIIYTIYSISRTINALTRSAEKIAKGESDVIVETGPKDAIGSLAASIVEIDANNKQLALAAHSIGRGDYNVDIHPRGESDELGIAICKMRDALEAYAAKMEALVKTRTTELERSNMELQQFAHVASHDLKEPLRKVATYTSRLIHGSEPLNETQENALHKIDQSARRMSSMIDGILSYSSVNGTQEPFELVDLNAVVQNVMTDLELVISEKQAVITVKKLPQLEGAPVLLTQLFYNLLNNALKFTLPGVKPEINIDCTKDVAGRYKIIVEDNGIGFDNNYADSIFNSFSRLHSKSEYEGTGLGLALCKKIIHYHNGSISAESDGNGAKFIMILPQKQEKQNVVRN